MKLDQAHVKGFGLVSTERISGNFRVALYLMGLWNELGRDQYKRFKPLVCYKGLCISFLTIKGTMQPTHYHGLLNQVGFSADELQELVYSLSYV
ncbi:hypothetical protein QVD17_15577 [Tagetes erecta]|uniref:Piwi domain-containing protein n=1 Tax=Tagetes erecta TaxID=13708 RepID=A0AAD8KV64_TARER|nr:hypothetical protein QVD17_15577 [Tagetes erecta]